MLAKIRMPSRTTWFVFGVFTLSNALFTLVIQAIGFPQVRWPQAESWILFWPVPIIGILASRRYGGVHGPLWLGVSTPVLSGLLFVAVASTFWCLAWVIRWDPVRYVAVGALASAFISPLLMVSAIASALLLCGLRIVPSVKNEWRWFWSDRK